MKEKKRYIVFIMLTLLILINYIDRGAIAYAANSIMTEYGFDNIQWGRILGFFGYGYLLGALIGGFLADRFGTKKMWLIAGVSWSLMIMATAIAGDLGLVVFGGSLVTGFATVRIIFGLAEGPAFSLLNKSISNWATPQERAFVVSVGMISTPIGALLTAPIVIGIHAATGSWKSIFIILGVVSFIFLFIFLKYFSNTPQESKFLSDSEKKFLSDESQKNNISNENDKNIRWFHFFKSRTLIFNAIGYFSFIYVTFFLLTWTPKYLQDEFKVNLSDLWYLGMIPWIGSCFTVLLGGKLSDWIYQKTGNLTYARSYLTASCLLLSTICFYMVSLATNVWSAVLLIALANAINSLINAVFWTVVIDTAPKSKVGTFSGLTHAIANTAAIIAPTLSGFLTVYYGYSSIFLATAVATGIGMLCMIFVRPGSKINI